MFFAKGKLAGNEEGLLLLCKMINLVDSRDMKEEMTKITECQMVRRDPYASKYLE
jgi:hypothetical protein